jgi:hypothetical protein
LPVHGFGTLGPQGTHVTHRRRKLGRLTRNHRDTLAPWTGDVHTRKVQSEIRFREQRSPAGRWSFPTLSLQVCPKMPGS